MRLFDGKKVANKILEKLKQKIEKENLKPKLAVFLVGEDEASKIYIRLKKEAAEKVGIGFELYKYDTAHFCHPGPRAKDLINRRKHQNEILHCVQNDILGTIDNLNKRDDISGIIVQLPLPQGLDRNKIISAINPLKDVDGFHPENRRLFEQGNPNFEPVLPSAILMAIKNAYTICHSERIRQLAEKRRISTTSMRSFAGAQDDNLKGKKAVALINSDIFGQMLKLALEKTGIECKYNLKKVCLISGMEGDLKDADIVITACGCPNLVRGEMIKQGAVVIDGGIYRYQDGQITGDVERKSIEKKAGFLTPVPGGIGPMVIALLLKNVYLAESRRRAKINL